MITFSLQSGSCGNCYYYESGGVRLLFDAGIPYKRACERMAAYAVAPGDFQGLFISHDHSDHTACAGVFHRKLKLPIFCSRDTHEVMSGRLGKVCSSVFQYFTPGDSVKIGHVTVHTIPTPHDAANPCAFIVDDGTYRVGILTDLGHCFPALRACLTDLDVAFLESNYDHEMLMSNPFYPQHLKNRISGKHGHLENSECAEMVRDHASDRLRMLLLSHLSQDNNSPAVALRTARNVLAGRPQIDVHVAPRDGVSPKVTRDLLRRPAAEQLMFAAWG
jgi:phosphoribosyl 1,2-cyclic phosphodiesterase